MKTLHTVLLASLLVSACYSAPRLTTEEERAFARQTVVNVETALIVLHATGKIEPQEFALAMEQLGTIREEIEQSATVAIGWSEITQKLANLALQWVAPK